MTKRLPIIEVDFAEDVHGNLPKEVKLRTTALKDGTIHAAVFSWEVYAALDKKVKMSTHYEDTVDNFQRDMQWGQGIQILEDPAYGNSRRAPVPLRVQKGNHVGRCLLLT